MVKPSINPLPTNDDCNPLFRPVFFTNGPARGELHLIHWKKTEVTMRVMPRPTYSLDDLVAENKDYPHPGPLDPMEPLEIKYRIKVDELPRPFTMPDGKEEFAYVAEVVV